MNKATIRHRCGLSHWTAMLLLAGSLAMSGCMEDGKDGAPGAQGPAGPQGDPAPVTSGGTPTATSIRVADLHGSANATEAVRGPNNAANPVTTIGSASINADGKLVVNFTVEQDGTAFTTLDPSAVTFYLARLTPETNGDPSYWLSYRNLSKTPNMDYTSVGGNSADTKRNQAQSLEKGNTTGGAWTNHGDGTYSYVTNTKVTDGFTIADAPGDGKTPIMDGTYAYDASLTHRVAIELADPDGTGPAIQGANNATYDFVPDGTTAVTRDIVDIANCNECHRTLGAHHSGGRNDTKLCVVCHNPSHYNPGSGNVLDFKVMVHKIHMGKHLTSVEAGGKYAILGAHGKDFSAVNFPANPANCTKCHKDPEGKTLADVDNWKTKPSMEACGACHDGINFADGTGTRVTGVSQASPTFTSSNASQSGHAGGVQVNKDCHVCHGSIGTQTKQDDDPAPIPNAHDFMKKIASSYTLDITVTEPDGSVPAGGFAVGDTPVVTLVLKDSSGNAIDPTMVEALCGGAKCGRGNQSANAWNLYVSGPRAVRKPALTTAAAANSSSTAGNDLRTSSGFASQDDYDAASGKLTGVVNRATMAADMKVVYQLAAITASTKPGTYIAYSYGFFPADSNGDGTNESGELAFNNRTTFQVKTATPELKVATNCLDCHSSGTQAQYDADPSSVVENVWHISSNYEHPARFDADDCGSCHDYQTYQDAKITTTSTNGVPDGVWKANKLGFGGMPVSKRLHGVHYGANLTHVTDNPGADYAEAALPQDVKNCQKCHPADTSTDTWNIVSSDMLRIAQTPLRAACSGCHDSDAAWAHMTTMTVDLTPNAVASPVNYDATTHPTLTGPFSGDEMEACAVCHN